MIQAKQIQLARLALIVDDQEINRDVLGVILEDSYDVIYACNGKEALTAAHDNLDRLAVILLDLNMPVMNGYDVLEYLRDNEQLKHIPVIVLTSDKEAELIALNMGAADFIPKPFDVHEIILARVNRVVALCEGRQLINETQTDSLTQLYNRGFFYYYADQIYRYHPEWHMDAFVLNINSFHSLNELNGWEFGNRLLREIGEEIRIFLEQTQGIASRFEADYFAIYCQHCEDYNSILERIQNRVNHISGHNNIQLRMGVMPWMEEVTPTQMFDRARVACNLIRGNYHTHLLVYNEAIRLRERYETQLINELNHAVESHQFQVNYQPKYDIQCDPPRLNSAEALVRWKHPEFGMIPPADFVPLFEEKGLIYIVDTFVWRQAGRQIAAWRDKFGFTLPVSVNLSRSDILNPDLEKTLFGVIEESGLSPKDLKLEVTESICTDDAQRMISVIEKLREYGFEIEMDDFGTGYSSLNMISLMPIDVLKLDMKFIKNIEANTKDLRMVELILDIAKYLGVPVVAEGAETQNQIKLLREASCDIVQGFYFSRPLPKEEFETLIQSELDKGRVNVPADMISS